MIKNLNNYEAICFGDFYLVNLPIGNYVISNGERISIAEYNNQVTLKQIDNIYKINMPKKTLSHYVDPDGMVISIEEYNLFHEDYDRKYYNKETYSYEYPSLEEEFSARKDKEYFARLVSVSNTPAQETYSLVDIKLLGYQIDTGSSFITSSIALGEIRAHSYVVYDGKIANDEFIKLSIKYSANGKFEVPNHSNIEFAKIDGSFLFTRQSEKFTKDIDIRSIHTTLENAKERETYIRKYVNDIIVMKLFPSHINVNMVNTLSEIYYKLENIRTALLSVSSKSATSSNYSMTVSLVNDLILKVKNKNIELHESTLSTRID